MVISSTINELVFNAVDTATLVKVALSPILMLSMLSVPTARVVIVALSKKALSAFIKSTDNCLMSAESTVRLVNVELSAFTVYP